VFAVPLPLYARRANIRIRDSEVPQRTKSGFERSSPTPRIGKLELIVGLFVKWAW